MMPVKGKPITIGSGIGGFGMVISIVVLVAIPLLILATP